MAYRVRLERRAEKGREDLPAAVKERVDKALLGLGNSPRPRGSLKLSGATGYRIRVGDYRVLDDVDDKAQTVTIYRIDHRKDVYRTTDQADRPVAVPGLAGCVATGATRKDVERSIREAIAFHLEGMRLEGLPVPTASTWAETVETAA